MRHLVLRYLNLRSLPSPLTFGTSTRLRSGTTWSRKASARPDALNALSGQIRLQRAYSQRSGTGPHNEGPRAPLRNEPDAAESGEQERSSDAPSPVSIPGAGFASRISKSPLFDALITTSIGITLLFFGGWGYVEWYKMNVLDKMEMAFGAGYDPALELAIHSKSRTSIPDEYETGANATTLHLRRKEQGEVDEIIHGKRTGHYYVLLGAKGTGKTTMIYDAMQRINADGVAVCDAHPDMEVFRLRLGKALNYEYHEDSQTGLFQRRDPREGGAALDIERALNKLEKVALRSVHKRKKPLVLVFNNVHYFQHDEEGKNMLLQLQQRAEAWAESGILTMVFGSDDFWPFAVLRKNANRMQVLTVSDLALSESLRASKRMRLSSKYFTAMPEESIMKEAVSMIGGRLSYLNKVMREVDVSKAAKAMLAREKGWLMSQIGLIKDCDDDVMDEQKWSSCSWLLLQEFVKEQDEMRKLRDEAIESGDPSAGQLADDMLIPSISYGRCRQIMTRTDFMDDLDRANIISIDVNHDVRPDSLLILQAAREVVEEEGFQDLLDSVRSRIDEIESLHRTRELTFKDIPDGGRLKLAVDKGGAMLLEPS